jgi:hypothetical protein
MVRAIPIPVLGSSPHGQQLHVVIGVRAARWTRPRLLCYELQENLGGDFESWVVGQEGLE